MSKPTRQELITKIKLKEELEVRKATQDLTSYTKFVNKGAWLPAKHLNLIHDKIDDLVNDRLVNDDGEVVDVLLLSMPPQHGKSMSTTEVIPSYYSSKYKNFSSMIVSYSSTLAERFNRKNREKVQEFGKRLFGVELRRENAGLLEFDNGSSIQASGLMGGITGNPADLIIIDDVVKNRQEAESETSRNNVWNEFRDSVRSRMSAGCKIILIMTRWHEDDLYGRIEHFPALSSYSLNLPIQAMEDDDVLGRKKGEALFPEIGKDDEWVEKFKQSYIQDPYDGGIRSWNALYMGQPSEREGNIFKRKYWKEYIYRSSFVNTLPVLILSVDASFKGGEDNDKVSIQVWGKKGANIYGIDNVTKVMGFTETVQTIISMIDKYPQIGARYVEDKANGSAIIEVLNNRIGGFVPVKADVSTGGKLARAYAIEPFVQSGNVFLPMDKVWAKEFINELASFPHGRYKDQVDAFTQALNKLVYFYADVQGNQVSYNDFFSKKVQKLGEGDLGMAYDIDDSFFNYG